MAIFSMRMQVIGRSAGRSATAAAAYRSGEEIRDELTGRTHDYTGKSEIYGSEILLPAGAPERLGDRTTLWNEVERVEKRKDAQLSREVMIALPAELNHWQKQQLACEYVQSEFVSEGMIADIGYHDFDSHNPHAHIMLTMRSVDQEGFGKKRREWNKRAAIAAHRQAWAEHVNQALARAGYTERIDHRSLEEQGVEREPQIHLGAKVMEMETRGIATQVGAEARRISKVNREILRQQKRCQRLRADIKIEQTSEQLSVASEERTVSELSVSVTPEPVAEKSDWMKTLSKSRSIDSNVEKPTTGVFEAVLRHIEPELLERAKTRLAESKRPEPPVKRKQQLEQERQRRRRRQIYGQYAAKFEGKSPRECDLLVVRQLMSELLAERGGRHLRDSEVTKVGNILLQGPVAQQLKQMQGKDAGVTYAMEVLAKAQKVVEKAQAGRQESSKHSQKKRTNDRDQGYEM